MWKIGLPVRSAVLKPHAGRVVVGWVTTSESLLLYVFFFFCTLSNFLDFGFSALATLSSPCLLSLPEAACLNTCKLHHYNKLEQGKEQKVCNRIFSRSYLCLRIQGRGLYMKYRSIETKNSGSESLAISQLGLLCHRSDDCLCIKITVPYTLSLVHRQPSSRTATSEPIPDAF